ncbi:MAG TPA: cellulase N-terminal Ig-like domain-containing protein, partial [Polyangiaceae bacterium]
MASSSGANSSGSSSVMNGGASTTAGASSSTGGTNSTGNAGTSSSDAGTGGVSITPPTQPLSKFIVVDQFGYRPDAEKIAVVRDPQTGFDAGDSFTPGKTYALIDAVSQKQVYSAAATAWNGGMTDATSGDKAWWFDFSSVNTPGTYYV